MGIELHGSHEAGDQAEPGEAAYEALSAVAVDAPELTLFALLQSIQRGDEWAKVPPAQRALCLSLERELFDEDGGDNDGGG